MLGQEEKQVLDPPGGVGVGGDGGLQLGGRVGEGGEEGGGAADLLADGQGCGGADAYGHPAGPSSHAHRPHTQGRRSDGQAAHGNRAHGEDALCAIKTLSQVDMDQREAEEGMRAAVFVVPEGVVVVDDGGARVKFGAAGGGGGVRPPDQVVQGDAEVVGQDDQLVDVGPGRASFPNLKR